MINRKNIDRNDPAYIELIEKACCTREEFLDETPEEEAMNDEHSRELLKKLGIEDYQK